MLLKVVYPWYCVASFSNNNVGTMWSVFLYIVFPWNDNHHNMVMIRITVFICLVVITKAGQFLVLLHLHKNTYNHHNTEKYQWAGNECRCFLIFRAENLLQLFHSYMEDIYQSLYNTWLSYTKGTTHYERVPYFVFIFRQSEKTVGEYWQIRSS
jgi:hypothetical protein